MKNKLMSQIEKLMAKKIVPALILVVILASCGDSKRESTSIPVRPVISAPDFNADSAFAFVQAQVDFGPRVPNTAAHGFAGDYLISQLEAYGGTVKVQSFEETTFDGVNLSLRNIMGQFNIEAKKRILLAAHWDTRPFADKDAENPSAIADGANDGASGVGVLLEVARVISQEQPTVGVDILFFDGEDWGEKEHSNHQVPTPNHLKSWWALGSQHWSKSKGNYHAYFGILLDMVGAKGSQFHIEGYSNNYAPGIVKKVWKTASEIGYSNYFTPQLQGAIDDDHLYVNQNTKIPMIDIIHFDPIVGYFGDYHHTLKDNMDIIDRRTLKAVGQTLLQVLYNE
jgi:Zn-dependent M28 family amino/carboxypeptidase